MDTDVELRLRPLMVRAQIGDTVAYSELLDELYELLGRYVGSQVRVNQEDIVQEIIVTVHKVRHTYDPSRPFLPWLYAIASHRIQDGKRSTWRQVRKVEVLREQIEGEEKFVYGGTSDLQDAVHELPLRQRKVVTMLKLEGFSVKEIAQQLSVSTNVVKVTAHRAYEALRSKLTEVPDEV